MKMPLVAGLQKLLSTDRKTAGPHKKSTEQSWVSIAVASAWALQCCGLLLAFIGIAAASGDPAARSSIAYMWFSILLQTTVSALWMAVRVKGESACETRIHIAFAAIISVMCLITTCDRAVQLSFVSEGGWKSVYGVIIAGCVLVLVPLLPLLSRMIAASLSGALGDQGVAAKLSLPQIGSLGTNKSELQFVDLRSAEEGRGTACSKPTQKGKYTAYSNPYADEAADTGTILPTLAPLAGYPQPPPDLPPSPPAAARVTLASLDTNSPSPTLRPMPGDEPTASMQTQAKSGKGKPPGASLGSPTSMIPTPRGVPTPDAQLQARADSRAMQLPALSAQCAARTVSARHDENAPLSAAHLQPAQRTDLSLEVERDDLEFASPRGATSTLDGDRTPMYSPQNFPTMAAAGPDFLNQGESETSSDGSQGHGA